MEHSFIQPTLFRIGNFLIPVAVQLYQPYSAGYEYHPHSPGAFVFVVATFNIFGILYSPHKFVDEPSILNNLRWKWKFIAVYIGVMLLFLLLNYGLLVAAKLMGRAENPFTFQIGGIRILLVVWLVELVILGLVACQPLHKECPPSATKAAQLQKENNAARYTALQNQLNPTFFLIV